MSDFPFLSVIAAVPLVGAAVVAFLPRGRDTLVKQVTLGFSLVAFALTVLMATQFDNGAAEQFQFAEHHAWIKQFGVSYAVGVDGIALLLIALSTIIVPLVIIASWHEIDTTRGSTNLFMALVLVLETMMVLVFAATDVFLFYVIFEAMLFPIYFLIGRYGGPQRSYAAVKFLLYGLLGGLVMLVALIGLYVASANQLGTGTFDFTTLVGLHLDPGTQKLLFLGFFFAFAIKAPLWPLHTWLPDASAESTPGVAVLLIAVLDKVGTFGMIRLCLPLFPEASHYFAPAIAVLAVISIIYGALLAIGQTDIKRLIAYTSVSHFGFIVLGIFVFTTQGQAGSTLYMVNHGFSTAALFIVAGYLISRRGSQKIADFGGVHKVAPVLAGTFLIAGLSSLAMPGMGPFVSEILVLVGAFARYKVAAGIAVVAVVLSALYILYMFQRVATGPVTKAVEGFRDLRGREVAAIAPLLAIILALGFAPQVVLNVINPAIDRTMQQVHATDPAPSVTPAEAAAAAVKKAAAEHSDATTEGTTK